MRDVLPGRAVPRFHRWAVVTTNERGATLIRSTHLTGWGAGRVLKAERRMRHEMGDWTMAALTAVRREPTDRAPRRRRVGRVLQLLRQRRVVRGDGGLMSVWQISRATALSQPVVLDALLLLAQRGEVVYRSPREDRAGAWRACSPAEQALRMRQRL